MGLDMYLGKKINPKGFREKIIKSLEKDDDEFLEVGYWRKAYQIQEFFVTNLDVEVKNGEYFFVNKELLIKLLDLVNRILEDNTLAEELIPLNFDITGYDKHYFEQLQDTKEILNKVLNETYFENEEIYFMAWW